MEDLAKKLIKVLGDEKEELLRRLKNIDGNIEKLKVKLNDMKKGKREENEKEEPEAKKRKKNDDEEEEEELGPSTSRADSVDKERWPLGAKFSQPFIFIADLTNEFLDKEEYLNDAHSLLEKLFNSRMDTVTLERKIGSLFAYDQDVLPGLQKFVKDARALPKSREEFEAYLSLEEKVRKKYGKCSGTYHLIKRLLNINRGNYLGTLTRDETLDKLFGKEEALKIAVKQYLLRFHGSDAPDSKVKK